MFRLQAILTLHLGRAIGQDLANVWTYTVALRGGCLDLEDQGQCRIVAQTHDCDDGPVEGSCNDGNAIKDKDKLAKTNTHTLD